MVIAGSLGLWHLGGQSHPALTAGWCSLIKIEAWHGADTTRARPQDWNPWVMGCHGIARLVGYNMELVCRTQVQLCAQTLPESVSARAGPWSDVFERYRTKRWSHPNTIICWTPVIQLLIIVDMPRSSWSVVPVVHSTSNIFYMSVGFVALWRSWMATKVSPGPVLSTSYGPSTSQSHCPGLKTQQKFDLGPSS